MPAADRAVPLQRFRCFGDLDAPDWILAEISVLAKVSSVRMKLIVSQVGLLTRCATAGPVFRARARRRQRRARDRRAAGVCW